MIKVKSNVDKTQPATPKAASNEPLDNAADALLAILPPNTSQILQEIAVQQAIPVWMLMCGLLLRVCEMGEHTAPSLDPQWLRDTPTVLAAALPDQKCPVCKKQFTPRWRGQQYDTNICGAADERARLDRHAAKHRNTRVPRPLGKEAITDVRSTIDVTGPNSADVVLADAQEAITTITKAITDGTSVEHITVRGLG